MYLSRGVLLVLALAGCHTDVPPDNSVEPAPPIPLEHCGSAPYALLPASQLGEALHHEVLIGWDVSVSDLQARVDIAGMEGVNMVHGVKMWRYRYTTQDRGVKVEATGIIAVPSHLKNPQPTPWPVALLLHGFMGATDACAPSRDPLIGPALPAILASQGYAVIAPDFIGMNGMGAASTALHAPLLGEQVALGSWDAWRAGRALLDGELSDESEQGLRDDVFLYGASQGGHAAFFTELFGPYYAPEANVIGVVAATPAHSLTAVAQDAVQTYSDRTGLAALAMVGMRRWYGHPASLDGVLTNNEPYFIVDTVEELLSQAADTCDFDVEFDASTVEEIYAQPYLDNALAWDESALDPWSCFFARSSISTSGVERLRETPVLAYYGEFDTLVAPELQEADFDILCEDGWQIEHRVCLGADHVGGTLWSLDEQLTWMRDRVDGVALSSTCERQAPVCCSGSPADICTP